ncbi:MAG TPA: hypothetical protein VGR51_08860 [Thermoplasmata archaeon]|jgi:hypothetical protein|nr:hypothetical protein [Thermoplasmata archaeon]
MTPLESLVGRQFVVSLTEPYNRAASEGSPRHACRGERITGLSDGSPILWVDLEHPMTVEGSPTTEIGLQVRHREMALEDVLKGYRLIANAFVPVDGSALHFFGVVELRLAESPQSR